MADHERDAKSGGKRLYDASKFVALILLPAIGTLYFAVSNIWHLPKAEEVVGTITAVDAFLGVVLGISAKQYGSGGVKYGGAIEITTDLENNKTNFMLQLDGPPEDLVTAKDVSFRIVNNTSH